MPFFFPSSLSPRPHQHPTFSRWAHLPSLRKQKAPEGSCSASHHQICKRTPLQVHKAGRVPVRDQAPSTMPLRVQNPSLHACLFWISKLWFLLHKQTGKAVVGPPLVLILLPSTSPLLLRVSPTDSSKGHLLILYPPAWQLSRTLFSLSSVHGNCP